MPQPTRIAPPILAAGCVAALLVLGVGDANAVDPLEGARAFQRCASCHSLQPDVHLAGPSLAGVFGKRAGTVEGYYYSRDLEKAGKKGLIWTEKTLYDFLGNPRGFLSAYLNQRRVRTKMRLGYPSHDYRDAVIAYLKQVNGVNSAKIRTARPPP